MKTSKQLYELLCLKVNGPSCNRDFVEMYSSTQASLDAAWLANYLVK